MSHLTTIRVQSTWRDIIEGQPQHIAIVFLMAIGAISLLDSALDSPKFLLLTSHGWAVLSIYLAIAHQVVTAIGFRLQLHRNLLTNKFGERDMQIWGKIFLPLLGVRPIILCVVGWTDTVGITGWRIPEVALGLALIGVAIWGMHSVIVYFTIPRAMGGDHFRDEYSEMPMVDQGVFKYSSNAMYAIIFLGLWGIALAFGSWNALVVALFQHAYIWVHMYCTEAPDMRWIYGQKADQPPFDPLRATVPRSCHWPFPRS